MNAYVAEQFQVGSYTVKVVQDEYSYDLDPRSTFDNAGRIVFNNASHLGDGIAEPLGHTRWMDYDEYMWSYECPRCEGEGWLNVYQDNQRECPKCGAEGFIRCSAVERVSPRRGRRVRQLVARRGLRLRGGGPRRSGRVVLGLHWRA